MLTPITDKIESQFPFGPFDGRIHLSRGYRYAFSMDQESADKRADVILDFRQVRVGDPGVISLNRSGRKVFNRLADDVYRLLELFHTYEVTVVNIAVLSDRDLKVKVAVTGVRKRLAHIIGHARSPETGAGQSVVNGFFG